MEGSMKVSDFMINVKMPKSQRKNWPLVFSGEEVDCIPGYQPSERAKISSSTSVVFKIQIGRDQEGHD
jgi:hypothetical protein